MAKKKKAKRKVKKVTRKKKKTASKKINKKFLGKVDHFYDKISVVTFTVKKPFKVGDIIHIKGHTSDFYQRIESIQIYHKEVAKAKKGDEVGIKLKQKAREHDVILLSNEAEMAAYRASQPRATVEPINISGKKPTAISEPPKTEFHSLFKRKPTPPPQRKKPESYGDVKFFKF